MKKENLKTILSEQRVLFTALAVLILLIGLYIQLGGQNAGKKASPANQNRTSDTANVKKQNLTKYQRNFVDCPPQYMDFCTRMSKIPTEKVSFIRTENGRIHLKVGEGRKMVARLPTNNSEGYMIQLKQYDFSRNTAN